MTQQRRPVLRWHGGKWRLAPWIVSHFPAHRQYVEPYGGAASVLIRKPRCFAEVWNDLDGEVVNLFRVLRSDDAQQLIRAVHLTPFSRADFEEAYQPTEDPVERARRLIARSFMGYGSTGANIKARTGFRANAHSQHTHPASDFTDMPEVLRQTAERFRGVVIDQRPALQVMRDHDAPTTLHYVDPPYLHSLRHERGWRGEKSRGYAHELTEQDHAELLGTLRALAGMVILSGYPSQLYDEALTAWVRVERAALADKGRPRREVLWINPAAAAAGPSMPLPLGDVA